MKAFFAAIAFFLLISPAHAFLNHVATNTALKALVGGVYPLVMRDGYAAAGDGGGVLYTWNGASSCTDDAGSCVAPNSGTGRWLAAFPETGAPIEAWGADRTGTNDSAAAIANAVTWACANTATLTARDGTYKLSASGISFTCDKDNVSLVGQSYNTIFSYSGNSNIDSIVSVDPGAGNNNWGWRLGPFTVTGNSHVNYGLHTTRFHHAQIAIRARNVAISGYYGQFGVSNTGWISCSNNEGSYTTQPANCFLGATDGTGGGLYASTFYVIAEGVSGSGIKLSTSNNNLFWGTSEGNDRGAELASTAKGNIFDGVDFEVNATEDVLDGGTRNEYRGLISSATGRFHLSATAQGTIVTGGTFDTITVDNGGGSTSQLVIHPETVATAATFSGTTPNIDYNGAWITYTPTLSCGGGTLTTSSAAGRYRVSGKSVQFGIRATITTNGTCNTVLNATLPFAATSIGNVNYVVVGRDEGIGGNALTGQMNGTTTLAIHKYENSYPAADGSAIDVTGTYEKQ